MKQEFEHSKVHSKLNDSYIKSLEKNITLFRYINYFKFIWRVYFQLILVSPFRSLLIIGEIFLGYNIFDVKDKLLFYKYTQMSNDMKKVLIYHELEEIEHGLDLVPIISQKSFFTRMMLTIAYNIHYALYIFILEIQTIILEIICKKSFDIQMLNPIMEMMLDPFKSVDVKILYSMIYNKYPSRKTRDVSESDFIIYSINLFDFDLSKDIVYI